MHKVILHQLQVPAKVGILDWEKKSIQTLLCDLEMQFDATSATQTDNIEDTIDYTQVRQSILDYCQNHRLNLLETLTHHIAEILQNKFQPMHLRLRLTKPDIFADAKGVSVEVEK